MQEELFGENARVVAVDEQVDREDSNEPQWVPASSPGGGGGGKPRHARLSGAGTPVHKYRPRRVSTSGIPLGPAHRRWSDAESGGEKSRESWTGSVPEGAVPEGGKDNLGKEGATTCTDDDENRGTTPAARTSTSRRQPTVFDLIGAGVGANRPPADRPGSSGSVRGRGWPQASCLGRLLFLFSILSFHRQQRQPCQNHKCALGYDGQVK